jgi:hypothetical protein
MLYLLTAYSVLDLGWADMVPLQFAAEYPRFLTHEPFQIHSGPHPRTVFDWQKKEYAYDETRPAILSRLRQRYSLFSGRYCTRLLSVAGSPRRMQQVLVV